MALRFLTSDISRVCPIKLGRRIIRNFVFKRIICSQLNYVFKSSRFCKVDVALRG